MDVRRFEGKKPRYRFQCYGKERYGDKCEIYITLWLGSQVPQSSQVAGIFFEKK